MRRTAYAAAVLLIMSGVSVSASAGKDDHVCPPHKRPPPPARAAGGDSTKPADASVQVMGCLERGYPLRMIRLKGAKRAVAIAEEPHSVAALFTYKTSAERDALIDDWMTRWTDESSPPAEPMTFYLAGHAVSAWRLPDGTSVGALYPEKAEAAILCIVRANVRALPDAQPVLNNWCMDRLGLWRKD